MKIFLVILAIFCLVFGVQSASEDCAKPKDVGPCRGHEERFFYDTATKKCQTFFYGGCQGNENNFKTESDCKSKCE